MEKKPRYIYIYNENCVMAGREVPQSELAKYDDPSDGNDWSRYEVSEAEEEFFEFRGQFGRRVAATIRAAM